MVEVHFSIWAFLSLSGTACNFRGSKVSPPRQPERSVPLNRATKPLGGFSAALLEEGPNKRETAARVNGNRVAIERLLSNVICLLYLGFRPWVKLFYSSCLKIDVGKKSKAPSSSLSRGRELIISVRADYG